jgi:hypothetical protein
LLWLLDTSVVEVARHVWKLGVGDWAAAIVCHYDHGIIEPHPGVDLL